MSGTKAKALVTAAVSGPGLDLLHDLADLVLALADPVALRGMTGGSVTGAWARTHRPRWYDEVTGVNGGTGVNGVNTASDATTDDHAPAEVAPGDR